MDTWALGLVELQLSCVFAAKNNFFRKKDAGKKRYSGSRDGFQKLNDKDIYTDSDEENIEFDKYYSQIMIV